MFLRKFNNFSSLHNLKTNFRTISSTTRPCGVARAELDKEVHEKLLKEEIKVENFQSMLQLILITHFSASKTCWN